MSYALYLHLRALCCFSVFVFVVNAMTMIISCYLLLCYVLLVLCCSVEGSRREVRDASELQVGTFVVLKEKHPVLHGIVQFVGQTSFASGVWVGVKLEIPLGKNNGIVQGVKYFQCLPLHGIFVRPQQLLLVVPPTVETSKAAHVPVKGDLPPTPEALSPPRRPNGNNNFDMSHAQCP